MPINYTPSAAAVIQYLGFPGEPDAAAAFQGFEAVPGLPLPRRLLEFLLTAAGNPLLHGIDLWTEPRWYRTLYEEMEEQIDADREDGTLRPPDTYHDSGLYAYSQIPRTAWHETLPDRLLIGSDDCGVVSYGIRLDALHSDDPAVAWHRETDPLTSWQDDWALSAFLLATVCDALLGRPSELAEDLLTDAGWHFAWYPNGTEALDRFGIDPAQLHPVRSLYLDPDDRQASLACCIADGELCLLETVHAGQSMLVISKPL